MCLAVPGKIVEINNEVDPIFRTGKVSFGGIMKDVNLSMLPDAKVSDYVMVHVGVALSIVDEDEANETIAYLKKMGEWTADGPKDMQA
jgi:hydrogenase expression/formation protein HypC